MKHAALVVALLAAPLAATVAQACVGNPDAGRGVIAAGFSGTDGAVGTAVSLGYRTSRVTFLLLRTSLSNSMIDPMTSWAGHAAMRIAKSSVCVVTGVEVARFDTQLEANTYWVTPTGGINDPLGGKYAMYAMPILVQTGSAHQLFDVGVRPFAVAGAVLQSERFDPRNGDLMKRAQIVPRVGVGLTLAVKRLVIQSTLTNRSAPHYSLAGWHNYASVQLKAGFRY